MAREGPFLFYAMLAGVFGALSGVCGKLSVVGTMEIAVVLRALSFAANVYSTGQMWRYYLKALSLGPTPIASIVNTGTNFAVSALFGFLVFSEGVNWVWCCGAILICIGMSIIVAQEAPSKPDHKEC